MTTTDDIVLRLDAKLASIARQGRTALVCFYIRADAEDLERLAKATERDLILGVIAEADQQPD